jgi:lysophospholipase L1-like esterase
MKRFIHSVLISALLFAAFAVLAPPARGQAKADQSGADKKFDLPDTDDGVPGAGPLRRADWFKKLWKERRSTWAGRVQQDQGAVVFLGDSITQGWGDDIGGAFLGAKVANRGISGDTSRGVLLRLKDDVLALKPAGVVLLIGTNDLEEKAEPEVIAGNLKLILAELKKHDAKMPIVLCQVFPSSATKSRPADKIKQLNTLYAAAVKGDAQVTFVETYTLFADADGDAKKEEFPDLLHPNKAGYAKWAAAIRPILATLGFVENEPDSFQPEAGFITLFDGRDLNGWGFRDPKTLEKKEAFDGKTASSDGRYVAKNGRLIVTTPPEGRKIGQLWTTREFPKNFTLKLEFRATPNADSGVFLLKPQLQCRDYPLAGPYKQLQKYKPQDWNEMVVVAKDGVANCTCNGEVLEAAFKLADSGPIGLEGDRGQMEYRRIRIQPQP